ncbi:MAG: two-component regulator propeller domain-containing protein [Bacteroides sp.]|nr:two-component regulator propeller domain-containing protein [Bacteroides sp.]
MKRFKFMMMFGLLMGLSITARNQDARNLASINEGVFVVKAVYVDSYGVKWFGTNRGLCRYNDLTWRYYTDADHLAGNQVNALTFEATNDEQHLWVATTEGISVLAFDADGITGSSSYTVENGLLNDDVADIAIDSRQGKFIGSEDGITWFHDGIMDSLIYTEYYPSMLSSPVRQMDIYGDTLYIAQDGGIGRFISGVDGITGASRWTSEYGVTPYSGNIRSVMVKGEEKQFFGTDVGLETHTTYFAKADWDLYSTDEGLVNNDVISIAEDEEGGLWFGTYGGVSSFKEDIWTSYTTAEGLLNDTVYDIAFDLDGSVWFATGAGACRLKNGVFEDFITSVPESISTALPLEIYYNPAAQSLQLAYQLNQSAPVSACLYNMRGMLVGQWTDLPSMSGEHHVEITLSGHSAGDYQDGIYVIQLIQGKMSNTRKIFISQ